MPFYLKIGIYLLAVAFAVASGRYNWKLLDRPGKTYVALLVCTIASEIMSLILATTVRNNMPLYHAFAVVQLTFIAAYFLQLQGMYTSVMILAILIVTTTLAILNCYYFETPTRINSNFLMLESIVVIILSVITLYRIMDNEAIEKPMQSIHFWIWFFLLILWSATFFYWALYVSISGSKEIYTRANFIRWLLNVLVYAGTGFALMKLPHKNARKQ